MKSFKSVLYAAERRGTPGEGYQESAVVRLLVSRMMFSTDCFECQMNVTA